jgi:hypothetical protein
MPPGEDDVDRLANGIWDEDCRIIVIWLMQHWSENLTL